jgi:hypothetical protein
VRLTSVKLIVPAVFVVCLAAAQAPKIGVIEFYGLRKLSPDKLAQVLHIKAGDPLPSSKGEMEDRLEEVSGVVQARVEALCCDAGNAILFIGIEERGAPHFAFRSEPNGDAVLPQQVIDTYQKFMETVQSAARREKMAEDLTQGHSLMADPEPRAQQEKFVEIARERLPLLREVVRSSSDADQRAIAAALIGYAPDKKAAAEDLQFAMQDPDEAVRANAMRAMTAIAVLAARRPELGIRISPTWFVEMLNSIVLSDRIRAATALLTLSDKDPAPLEQIRGRALDSILEMARWKSLSYALPAFVLAGRMAGLDQKQIEAAWTKGDRETVLARLRHK